MRIALVTETFPPEVNGVARTLEQLSLGLAGRGHELQVVRPRQGPPTADRPWREVLSLACPIPMYPGLRFGVPVLLRLRRRWREWRPDVVHIATEGPLGLAALRAANVLDLPVSSTFHTNFHDYGRFYGYGGFFKVAVAYLRWFHNRTRITLVPGPDVVERLADRGFERLDVLARGVDREQFRPNRRDPELRREWGVGPDERVAVYVGRLASEKNPTLAIRAFESLRRQDPSWRCVVVGDGPAAAEMRDGFPGAIYAGMRRGADLAAHYASGDLLIFPSLTETFGNVLLEGMACGVAPIGFDYAAARQLVEHGVDGLVAPRSDADAFLEQVERAGAMPLADLRSMGDRAATKAAGWTWQRIVERFEGYLRAVAGQAPAEARAA
ncbi:MAG: glycosyltransferase family 1 protein [Acidobacteriota bacterium]